MLTFSFYKDIMPKIHCTVSVFQVLYKTYFLRYISEINGSISGNHHQCRNPNGTYTGPWCYTDSSYRHMELCDVPKCKSANQDILFTLANSNGILIASNRFCLFTLLLRLITIFFWSGEKRAGPKKNASYEMYLCILDCQW